MKITLPRLLITRFSDYVAKTMGLHFPEEKWPDLERGVTAIAKDLQCETPENCIQLLMSSPLNHKQMEIVASHLTTGETYFFRDHKTLTAFQNDVLKPLIQKRYSENKNLRLWSAGCSSGEEPYTLAIILKKLIPDIDQWNITLLATDINIKALHKLSKGIYSEWSFRDVPLTIKDTYFNKLENGHYEILPSIKKMVEPFYLNLCEDSYPSLTNNTNAMDIIFCRNVLMYFSPELIRAVVKKFFSCLTDNGILIVGPSEGMYNYFSDFKIESHNGVTYFKKGSSPVMKEKEVIFPPLMANATPAKEMDISPANFKELAQQAADQGKLQEALEWSKKGIAENKTNADLYYLHAMILAELGKHIEAIKTLKQVLYLQSNFILAYFMLGSFAYRDNKTREAQKYFDHALSIMNDLDPKSILPESGGMTVERLTEAVHSMQERG
jgi:chemotaxis protein methyltransferase CheR